MLLRDIWDLFNLGLLDPINRIIPFSGAPYILLPIKSFLKQEWSRKKSELKNELTKLELELQSVTRARNQADDELADFCQKVFSLEEKLEKLRSDLHDEKINSEIKLSSMKNEFEEKMQVMREGFEREKSELISEHNDRYSRLEEECGNLKGQLIKDRQMWEEMLEIRKKEEAEERKKFAEEKELEKVRISINYL
jgi:chromosome segregation ATPase